MFLHRIAAARSTLFLAALCLAATPCAAAVAAPAGPPFNAAARASELDRIAALIAAHYVFADKAAAIAAEVRGLKDDPELSGAADRATWAAALTRRLAPRDAHFSVTWAPGGAASAAPLMAARQDPEAAERQMAASNYGFDAVERLPGNIGYVRLAYFASFDRTLIGDKTPAARRAAEAALALIATTDAVIFDLRGNGGGSPDMIDLLLAPFLGDKPVLLNRFIQRQGAPIDFTTVTNFEGLRRPATPIYVLTSGRTASAAEEFAYDVQTQKRGVIVGETTYGGADPGGAFDAGDGFSVFISTGAAVNPITGRNWEGVGVKPDVAAPADEALARAQALALGQVLQKNASRAPVEARWTLERLNAVAAGVRVDPAHAGDYVGDFSGRAIALEDGQLIYRRARFTPQPLIALGQDVFALAASPTIRLSFDRAPDGKVAALVIGGVDGESARYPRSAPAGASRP